MERKKEEKNNKKTCYDCSEKIDLDKEKYVLLITEDKNNSLVEKVYFHFPCWVDYFNQKVDNKARAVVEEMQKRSVMLFEHPMIKNYLKKIEGSDIALNMLKTPINIKNGTKKRRGKGTKRQ